MSSDLYMCEWFFNLSESKPVAIISYFSFENNNLRDCPNKPLPPVIKIFFKIIYLITI